MKGYKAFEKGLVCKGKQYKENTVFEEDQAEICECGMHFCKNPLDVWNYYPCDPDTEYAAVEAIEDVKTNDGQKFCTKKLKIGAKLSLKGLIDAAVEFIAEKANINTDDYSKLAASGDCSQLAASGYSSKLAASGDCSQLAASGNCSVVANIGINGMAKASKGSWIVLAEYDANYKIKKVVSKQVDGKKILPDTWYKLKEGKFVEQKEEI